MPNRLSPAGTKQRRLLAQGHWAAGRGDVALQEAVAAYRLDPGDLDLKILLARLLGEFPAAASADMRPEILGLLQDKDIAPDYIGVAGWVLLIRDPSWNQAWSQTECDALAQRLNGDELGLALLQEVPVFLRHAEQVLARLRRFLFVSGKWQQYESLTDALINQARLNGGAWPFDEIERTQLAREPAHKMTEAYVPARAEEPAKQGIIFTDPITRAVAEDYERWPYPAWRRIMTPEIKLLPEQIRALDPGGPEGLPVNAKILIAGCGTGSEAAQIAREYPDAAVTAIDISRTSLAYARQQCAALGLDRIRFAQLDVHKVSELNERFDAIFCSGVLHHLPDPEKGWAALAGVLRTGGVMRIMLYSKAARVWIVEARALIQDLIAEPRSDDVLRRVRRRFLDRANDPRAQRVLNASAFATLAGTNDLLLHRQEDCFDVPRIARALEHLRLRLLTFLIPMPDAAARYDRLFPRDRAHRDLQSWAIFERHEPSAFESQYAFWCRS